MSKSSETETETETEIVEDNLEDKQPTEDELQDFKNKMAEWLKMDEQINKL